MVKIKSKRQELKKSQPEIADALQKDVPLISKFENYVCLPTPDDASKLVEILGCSYKIKRAKFFLAIINNVYV